MTLRNLVLGGLALALPVVAAAPGTGATGSSIQKAAPVFAPSRFSTLVRGSGPDVILIPGLTASRDIWNGTVVAVPGYRYHLVQVAGFAGESARGNAKGPVVASVAEEIARYIKARGLQRPAIIGHSMGGTISMMVAARHPALVGKVMVVDMLPQPAGILGSSAAGMKGLAESLRNLSATPGGRRLMGSLIEMFGPPESSKRQSDPDVVARATHELAVTDLSRELPKIAAPLTVVYAADPEASSPTAIDRAYADAYAPKRGVRRVRIDHSGHMIMWDQPTAFRAALKKFLKS